MGAALDHQHTGPWTTDDEWFWRLELEPSPTLVVAHLEDGPVCGPGGGRGGPADLDRPTWIERPSPVGLDPGALVRPRR